MYCTASRVSWASPERRAGRIRRSRCGGFTLLELLVAVMVFAVMSTLAFTGLRTMLDAEESTEAAARQLLKLQSTMYWLEQDLQYLVSRTARDELGGVQPALAAGNTGYSGLSLTRIGRRNLRQDARSSLMRVYYELQDKTLVRNQYLHVDQGGVTTPLQRQLLEDVEAFEFRFLQDNNQWSLFWPPVTNQGDANALLPRAVEIRLQTQRWGEIIRLIAVGQG